MVDVWFTLHSTTRMSAWWPIPGSPPDRYWQPAVKVPVRFQRHEVFDIQRREAQIPRCICGWSTWPMYRIFCDGMLRLPHRLTDSKLKEINKKNILTKDSLFLVYFQRTLRDVTQLGSSQPADFCGVDESCTKSQHHIIMFIAKVDLRWGKTEFNQY